MSYQYIDNQPALDALCEQLSKASVIAVDTEFVRTRTLYAKLGLLQVSDGQQLALIDPLAVDDLSGFWRLITDEKITKVLHACSEDLEIFQMVGQCKPANLIDSQVMMSFLGHGLSMGYAAMVKHYCQVELDKSESRTDWMKRPLTDKQLSYASADVSYLISLYPKLLQDIKDAGYWDYVQQESNNLVEKKFTDIDEDSLYRHIKMSWRLNPKQLNSLKHLARWRYQQAKKRDLPIGFIAKDHTLMAVAQANPSSISAMLNLTGVELLDVRHKGKAMLAVLRQAEKDDISSYPKKIQRLDEHPGYKQIFKKLKAFMTAISEQSGIAVENLASKKQLNQFLTWHFNINDAQASSLHVDLLSDWRYQLFGQSLQDFAARGFAER